MLPQTKFEDGLCCLLFVTKPHTTQMGYSYYCPHIAYGFIPVELPNGAILMIHDSHYIRVFATEVNKGYICQAFIGIVCDLDPVSGHASYTPEAYDELMRFIELYKSYHHIHADIPLGFRPVISGDWEYERSYTIDGDD